MSIPQGPIVPLVTPFRPDESLDLETLGQVVEFAIDEDASGLMVTALTGEGPLLDTDETLGVWDAVFAAVRRRVPVIPAVLSSTTRRAVSLVKAAEARGAAAVMVAPILPELYAGRSEADVTHFFADVAAASSLPVALFNYPSLTGVDLTPSFVARLALAIDRIQYIKESSGETARIHEIQRLTDGRLDVICGTPHVALESLALGCRTWITGTLNVVPRSGRQLMRAVELGDLALARRINRRQILPIFHVIRDSLNPTGTIKQGLAYRGIRAGVPRRPGRPLDAHHLQTLEACVVDAAACESMVDTELARLTGKPLL